MRGNAKAGWLIAIAVFAAAYGNALSGVFQFDDFNVIVQNPDVQSWSAWSESAAGGIRPLLKLSYLLNWLTQSGASGFIAVNLVIHAACAGLVWQLTGEYLRSPGTFGSHPAEDSGQSNAVRFAATLVFLVHPLNTEAVTYVSGRSSSLMALCYLAGLLTYARQTPAGELTRRRIWLVLLWFGLALMVKETAVTFPLALLLWDRCRGIPLHRIWQRQWAVWVLFLAGSAYMLFSSAFQAHIQRSIELNTLTGNLATQALAWAYLCGQWWLPLWPNIDPDLQVRTSLAGVTPHIAWLLACCAVVPLTWKRRPWLAFALAWALLHLVPLYLFLPRLDVANDRQWYLAGWPLGMALAIEISRACRKTCAAALLVVLIGAYTVLTHQRNRDYHSEMALWEATLPLSPGKARVHNNLGYAYQLAGQNQQARARYERALELDPGHIQAHFNLRALQRAAP